jgi:hypothetical protein
MGGPLSHRLQKNKCFPHSGQSSQLVFDIADGSAEFLPTVARSALVILSIDPPLAYLTEVYQAPQLLSRR